MPQEQEHGPLLAVIDPRDPVGTVLMPQEDDRRAVLAALRAAAAERGAWWPMRLWRRSGRRPPVHVVLRLWGRWSAAWEAAGCPPPLRWRPRVPERPWTRRSALEAIRRVAGSDGITGREYARRQRRAAAPALATVVKMFGSWDAARRAAGLPEPRSARSADPDQLARAAAALWRGLGRPPRQADWDAWGGRLCDSQIASRIAGGWAALLAGARRLDPGLPARPPRSAAARALLAVPPDRLPPKARWLRERVAAGHSLRAAGRELGVSAEWARQIAIRAARRGGAA